MTMLHKSQIDFFKTQGYLILKGFVETERMAAWREQFWAHVGVDAQDPANWPDSYVIDGFAVDPAFGQLLQMQAVVEQLGGGQFVGGGWVVIGAVAKKRVDMGLARPGSHRWLWAEWVEWWFYARRDGLSR